MTELAQLQRWFLHVITDQQSVLAGLESAPDALSNAAASAAARVTPSAHMSPTERLDVYHHAYRARLIECLADDYPALRHALGVTDFNALCRAYIARFPSRSPSLNRYGQQMAAFCAEQPAYADFHRELAQLEWAVVEVIHAHDGEPIALSTLAALSPEAWGQVSLTPSPALRVLQQHYPVNGYYQAFRDAARAELPTRQPDAMLVRRRGGLVVREPLTLLAAQLLAELLDAQPIAHALEAAAGRGMTAEQVGSCFEHWIGSGCFIGIHGAAG